jgi:L-fuculose-phosphate aldolase
MRYPSERALLIHGSRHMRKLGLVHGTSGNLSVAAAEGMLITPTGISYQLMRPADIVLMSLAGSRVKGERRQPSTEWRMHAAIYRARPDVTAVVHGHSPMASTIACTGRDIPAIHYMIATALGDSIRCAPYASFGSDPLARATVKALDGRRACLLAHHGFVAVGADLDHAIRVAEELEWLAGVYWRLLALGSEPAQLSKAAMKDVLTQFRSYGQTRALE